MTGFHDNGDGTVTISKRTLHVIGAALLAQALALVGTGISMYVELQVLKAKVEDMAENLRDLKTAQGRAGVPMSKPVAVLRERKREAG